MADAPHVAVHDIALASCLGRMAPIISVLFSVGCVADQHNPHRLQLDLEGDSIPALNAQIAMAVALLLMAVVLGVVWRHARRWKAKAQVLALREARFRAYARMSSHWYWEQDENFRFTWVSGGMFDRSGVKAEAYIGRTRWDIPNETPVAALAAHRAILDAREPFHDFEYSVRDEKGEINYFSVNGEPYFDGSMNFKGYRGTAKDITDQKHMEAQVLHMAMYDALTGLPNRTLFYDHLTKALAMARRKGQQLAIVYLDLDHFKPVNDNWGHHAGDLLLKAVAGRALAAVRKSDTVGRLGGDEFAILLPDVGTRMNAHQVAEKVRETIAQPYTLEGVKELIHIGVSFGITLFPEDGESIDELVQKADGAMYSKKSERAGRIVTSLG